MAGYSGTPLIKKLGIKEGFNIAFKNAPSDFAKSLDLPPDITVHARPRKLLDFVLLFVKSEKDLTAKFSTYAGQLMPAGMLWIAWPKRASGVITDLTEDVVRTIGIANGMVDVKVCAIDEVWSGLKFVYRLKDREKMKKSS